MPQFKVLHIIEIDESDNKTDHQLFVLYDINDGRYYYFGTRNRDFEKSMKHAVYSGNYAYENFEQFVGFLDYIMEKMDVKTTELYDIYIDESEYEDLNYYDIRKKCNDSNILGAYDRMKPNSKIFKQNLKMLVSA